MLLLTLIAVLFALASGVTVKDDLAWEHLPNLTNTYYFSDVGMNYLDSIKFCSSYGAELLSIETKFEDLALANRLALTADAQNHSYWTSGSDQFKEAQWVWMSTGQPIDYKEWCRFEPGDHTHSENCLQIVGSQNWCWNDANCNWNKYGNVEFRFICEKTPIIC